ncbi:MAG: signal peptidase I [Lachnospiraceae bacterium]|nr:signal peptidase I [Lachnospiraceae bacterium]
MKKFLKEAVQTSLVLLLALIISFLIVTFVGQRTVVDGDSMENTLHHGDNLIVDKITYRFREPERFEVIVFPAHYDQHTYLVKRIIALPGETVYIDDKGDIYINDELLEEDFGKEVILSAGTAKEPLTLGDDEYFVLGDNRNNSLDSRDYMVGNVLKEDIIGRAWVRIYPFDSICVIEHE